MLNLVAGKRCRIRTKDWTAPDGEVVPGKEVERTVVGPREVEGVDFVLVRREDGSKHLIAVDTIQSAEPA